MAQIDKDERSPAFRLYAADFLVDENVVLMNNQQRGCYIMLICYCWREGSIPDDPTKLARLCGEDSSAMAELWLGIKQCFSEAMDQPGRLVHKRLVDERNKQVEYRENRSKAGAKGAKARWDKDLRADGSAMAEPLAKPMAKDGFSFSSSLSDKPPKPPKGGLPVGFDEFWAVYPNRNAKQDAIKAFRSLTPKPDLLATILADVATRSQGEAWAKDDGKFIPLPATYLRGKRWEDQGVTAKVVSKQWFDSQSGIRSKGDQLRVPYNNAMASGGGWLRYAAAVWVAAGDGPHWDHGSVVYPHAAELRDRQSGGLEAMMPSLGMGV